MSLLLAENLEEIFSSDDVANATEAVVLFDFQLEAEEYFITEKAEGSVISLIYMYSPY